MEIFSTITACADKPYGHYEDDKMIGTVMNVDTDNKLVDVDISEWHKRDIRGPGVNDYGVSISVEITDETVIRHENGTATEIESLKTGQKVLVNPPRRDDNHNVAAEEIILLEMTYEEKYSGLLSHKDDKLKIVEFFNHSSELRRLIK